MSLQLGGNGGISGCTSLSAPEVITVSGLIVGSGTTANQIGAGFRQGPNGSIVPVSNSGDVAYMYANPTVGSGDGVSTISINYDGTPISLFPTDTITGGRAIGGFQIRRSADTGSVLNGFLLLPGSGVDSLGEAYNGLGRGGTEDAPLPCTSGTALWLGYGHGFNGRNNQRGGYLSLRTARNSAILATEIQTSGQYQIISVGTSDFTAIGAASNNIGTVFTATSAGTGNGTVQFNNGTVRGNLPSEFIFAVSEDRTGNTTGQQNATQRIAIRSDGTLDLFNSPGIQFANAGANATSKTLDDYEEGTWTPSPRISSAVLGGVTNPSGSIGTLTASGRYIKIGKMCHVECITDFDAASLQPASGDRVIYDGLPYRPKSAGNIGVRAAGTSFVYNAIANGRYAMGAGTVNADDTVDMLIHTRVGNVNYGHRVTINVTYEIID